MGEPPPPARRGSPRVGSPRVRQPTEEKAALSIRRAVVVAAFCPPWAGAATSALVFGLRGPGASPSTQSCFDFTVVQPDPAGHSSPAGDLSPPETSARANSLSCSTTYNIFRSYLYDPQSLSGWTVGPLTGSLRGQIGKRFVQKGHEQQRRLQHLPHRTQAGGEAVGEEHQPPGEHHADLLGDRVHAHSRRGGRTVQAGSTAPGSQILQSGYRISGSPTPSTSPRSRHRA